MSLFYICFFESLSANRIPSVLSSNRDELLLYSSVTKQYAVSLNWSLQMVTMIGASLGGTTGREVALELICMAVALIVNAIIISEVAVLASKAMQREVTLSAKVCHAC